MEGNYDLVKFSLYRQVVVGANKNSFLRPDEKSKFGEQGASYLWASLSKLFRHFKYLFQVEKEDEEVSSTYLPKHTFCYLGYYI